MGNAGNGLKQVGVVEKENLMAERHGFHQIVEGCPSAFPDGFGVDAVPSELDASFDSLIRYLGVLYPYVIKDDMKTLSFGRRHGTHDAVPGQRAFLVERDFLSQAGAYEMDRLSSGAKLCRVIVPVPSMRNQYLVGVDARHVGHEGGAFP